MRAHAVQGAQLVDVAWLPMHIVTAVRDAMRGDEVLVAIEGDTPDDPPSFTVHSLAKLHASIRRLAPTLRPGGVFAMAKDFGRGSARHVVLDLPRSASPAAFVTK